MLPITFEWHWDVGHFVFMGLFYTALAIIGGGLALAFKATMKDLCSGKDPHEHGHH
jgi:hypothetical protein